MNKHEEKHWERVARLGCIACLLDGEENSYVSLHHVHGRTKKDAHLNILPLCAGHHQNGTGQDKYTVAVHPYKARFEALYGPQEDLLWLVAELLNKECAFTQSELLDAYKKKDGGTTW